MILVVFQGMGRHDKTTFGLKIVNQVVGQLVTCTDLICSRTYRRQFVRTTHVRDSDYTVFFSGETGGFVAHGYLDRGLPAMVGLSKVGSSGCRMGCVRIFLGSRGRGISFRYKGTRALEVEISRTPTIFK